jgi:hypothetical protein
MVSLPNPSPRIFGGGSLKSVILLYHGPFEDQPQREIRLVSYGSTSALAISLFSNSVRQLHYNSADEEVQIAKFLPREVAIFVAN